MKTYKNLYFFQISSYKLIDDNIHLYEIYAKIINRYEKF